MDQRFPNEVRSDCKLNSNTSSGDWLDKGFQLEFGELSDDLVNELSQFVVLQNLIQLLLRHDTVVLP